MLELKIERAEIYKINFEHMKFPIYKLTNDKFEKLKIQAIIVSPLQSQCTRTPGGNYTPFLGAN
jgi:hypothetical protein